MRLPCSGLEVFAELHTLLQFEQDAKHYLPLILVGQATVIDKLSFEHPPPGITGHHPMSPGGPESFRYASIYLPPHQALRYREQSLR